MHWTQKIKRQNRILKSKYRRTVDQLNRSNNTVRVIWNMWIIIVLANLVLSLIIYTLIKGI